jgi:hypothetical protein
VSRKKAQISQGFFCTTPVLAGPSIGGGEGNRTPVRKSYAKGVYMLVSVFRV